MASTIGTLFGSGKWVRPGTGGRSIIRDAEDEDMKISLYQDYSSLVTGHLGVDPTLLVVIPTGIGA